MASRTPPEIPEVEFHFVGNDNLTPRQRKRKFKKLLAKRDAYFRKMGLPPVETHEDCHKSGEDEHASDKLASSPERPAEPASRQAIHRKTSLLDEKQEQMFCSHCGQEPKMASRTPPEIPEVEFHFVGNDNLTPKQRKRKFKKLLAKRDAYFRKMGLPPVETHEDCHKPGEDEHASDNLASSPERPTEPASRQAIHRKTSLLDEKQVQKFCSHCGQELKEAYHFCPICGTKVEPIHS